MNKIMSLLVDLVCCLCSLLVCARVINGQVQRVLPSSLYQFIQRFAEVSPRLPQFIMVLGIHHASNIF